MADFKTIVVDSINYQIKYPELSSFKNANNIQSSLQYYSEDTINNKSTISADLIHISANMIVGGNWGNTPVRLGCKAFRMASKIEADGDNYKVALTDNSDIIAYETLSNTTYASVLNPSSEILSGYKVGDILSMINNQKCYNSIKIEAINGNGITYSCVGTSWDPYVQQLNPLNVSDFDDYVVFNLANPSIGIVEIAPISYSIGAGNTVNGYFGLAIGRQNQTYGNFGLTIGRGNKASYAAFAGGMYSTADYRAFAFGNYCYANEWSSIAIGDHCSISSKSGVALGAYNVDNKDIALAVGNGTSDTNRKNILQLDKSGNLIVTGNISANTYVGDFIGNTKTDDINVTNIITYGSGNIINNAAKSFVGGWNNKIDFTSLTSTPFANTINGYQNVISSDTNDINICNIIGTRNEAKNGIQTIAIGQDNVLTQTRQILVGAYLSADVQRTTIIGQFSDASEIPVDSVVLAAGTTADNRKNVLIGRNGEAKICNKLTLPVYDTSGNKLSEYKEVRIVKTDDNIYSLEIV